MELVQQCGGICFVQYKDANNKTMTYCSDDALWLKYTQEGIHPEGSRMDGEGSEIKEAYPTPSKINDADFNFIGTKEKQQLFVEQSASADLASSNVVEQSTSADIESNNVVDLQLEVVHKMPPGPVPIVTAQCVPIEESYMTENTFSGETQNDTEQQPPKNVLLQEANISQTKPASGDQDSAQIIQHTNDGNNREVGANIHMLTTTSEFLDGTQKQQLERQVTIEEPALNESGIGAKDDNQKQEPARDTPGGKTTSPLKTYNDEKSDNTREESIALVTPPEDGPLDIGSSSTQGQDTDMGKAVSPSKAHHNVTAGVMLRQLPVGHLQVNANGSQGSTNHLQPAKPMDHPGMPSQYYLREAHDKTQNQQPIQTDIPIGPAACPANEHEVQQKLSDEPFVPLEEGASVSRDPHKQQSAMNSSKEEAQEMVVVSEITQRLVSRVMPDMSSQDIFKETHDGTQIQQIDLPMEPDMPMGPPNEQRHVQLNVSEELNVPVVPPVPQPLQHVLQQVDVPAADTNKVFCICNGPEVLPMVACDNRKCDKEWFHFKCVGIKRKPRSTWLCPNCSTKGNKRRKSRK